MNVFALGGNGATPDTNPDHNVADKNEGERQQVAEDDVSHHEVDVFFMLGRPLFDAQQDFGTV